MFQTIFPLYNNTDELYLSNYLRTNDIPDQSVYIQYVQDYILPEVMLTKDKIFVNPKSLSLDKYKNLRSGGKQDSFVSTYTESRQEIAKNVDPLELCVTFFLSRYPYINHYQEQYHPFPILHNFSYCNKDILRTIYDDKDKNDPPSPTVECFGKDLFMITSKSEGMTFRDIILSKFITPQEIFKVYLAILITLANIEKSFVEGVKKFTHYDLHTENILVNTDIIRTYSIQLDDRLFELNTFGVNIIDFGLSYLMAEVGTNVKDVQQEVKESEISVGGVKESKISVGGVQQDVDRKYGGSLSSIEMYEDYSISANVYRYYHPLSDFNKLTLYTLVDLDKMNILPAYRMINEIYRGITGVRPNIIRYGLPSLSERSLAVNHDQLMKGVMNIMIESENPLRESIMMREERVLVV